VTQLEPEFQFKVFCVLLKSRCAIVPIAVGAFHRLLASIAAHSGAGFTQLQLLEPLVVGLAWCKGNWKNLRDDQHQRIVQGFIGITGSIDEACSAGADDQQRRRAFCLRTIAESVLPIAAHQMQVAEGSWSRVLAECEDSSGQLVMHPKGVLLMEAVAPAVRAIKMVEECGINALSAASAGMLEGLLRRRGAARSSSSWPLWSARNSIIRVVP
jgi:hypothetical protein